MLVEGVTVAGLAAAAVLRRAGYDPVVVGSDHDPASRLSIVSPRAFGLLDALGAAPTVRAAGAPIGSVSVWRTDGREWTDRRLTGGEKWEREPPVVCRTATLRRALYGTVPAESVDRDRRIEALEPRADAVVVAFADGVREPFDLVVRATPRSDATTPGASLRGVEVETARPPRPIDAWGPRSVAQALPDPGAEGPGGVLRIATTAADPIARLRAGAWPPAMPAGAVAPASVDLRQFERPGAGTWGEGRIVRCGAAATPVAPATGLGAALGLADARALGIELARDATVAEAVDAYARRRRRAVAALFTRRAADAGGPTAYPPVDGPTPLSAVATLRVAGLGIGSGSGRSGP
jgi:2-polyprenyl-6-methoxyphenol hydroxylase-like FAD-dependent oxidoreductase